MRKYGKTGIRIRNTGVGLFLFGFIFLVAGLGLLGMSFYLLFQQTQPHGRVQTPCLIEKLETAAAADQRLPFSLTTRFSYTWQGAVHVSMQCLPDGQPLAHRNLEELETIRRDKLAAPVCFVNPDEPREASLFHHDAEKTDGLGVFVGGGIIFSCLGIGLIRSGRNPALDGLLLASVIGLFLAAGVYSSANLLVMPAFRYVETRFWQKCDATVIWSRVRSETSKGGRRGSSCYPDIFYEYQYAGETRRSNNVTIMPVATNIGSYAQDIVAKNHEGARVICYVNPKNPGRAVLDRGIGWRWLMGLFPLPFLAIGGIGVHWGINEARKKLRKKRNGRKISG